MEMRPRVLAVLQPQASQGRAGCWGAQEGTGGRVEFALWGRYGAGRDRKQTALC